MTTLARSCRFPRMRIEMVPPGPQDVSRPHSCAPEGASREPSISETESLSRKWRAPPIITLLFSIRFLSALWGVFVQALITSAFQAVLPLAVHEFFQWGSTNAGLMFIPLAVPAFFGPLVGRASDRMGPRWIATAGFVLLCPALVSLRFVDRNSTGNKILFVILLALTGCGVTLTLEPLMAEITHVTSKKQQESGNKAAMHKSELAQAYALFNMAWAAGNTVGPLWGGLLMDSAGWRTLTWSLGLLGGASVVPTVVWCGGSLFRRVANGRRS